MARQAADKDLMVCTEINASFDVVDDLFVGLLYLEITEQHRVKLYMWLITKDDQSALYSFTRIRLIAMLTYIYVWTFDFASNWFSLNVFRIKSPSGRHRTKFEIHRERSLYHPCVGIYNLSYTFVYVQWMYTPGPPQCDFNPDEENAPLVLTRSVRIMHLFGSTISSSSDILVDPSNQGGFSLLELLSGIINLGLAWLHMAAFVLIV